MKQVKEAVCRGVVGQPISDFYSSELRALCTSMLTVAVADRPTVAEVLAMPWTRLVDTLDRFQEGRNQGATKLMDNVDYRINQWTTNT